MKVRDVMTSDVISLRVDTPFREIVELLVDHGLSGAPVVDALGTVVGVVTENDLLAKEAYPPRKEDRSVGRTLLEWIAGRDPISELKAEAMHAANLMSEPPITIAPDESVHAAARRMLEHNVKRLPVVKNGKLVGLVSRHDVMKVYARPDATLAAEVDAMLTRSLYTPPDNRITVRVNEGIAVLEGTAHYRSDIRIISNLVAAVDGVTRVDNRLRYREPEPSMRELRNDPRNIMTR